MATATEALFALLTLAGLAYLLLALWSARAFSRDIAFSRDRAFSRDIAFSRRPQPAASQPEAPGLSLLKPLHGLDPNLEAALASHCTQAYPGPYEILCGVSSPEDPAVAAVTRLQATFPAVAIHLILCPDRLGPSGKLSNLVQMAPQARYAHLVINDADIHVPPGYLTGVAAAFATPNTGMVTAPYLGRCVPGPQGRIPLWSRLEALGITTDFMPGVLTARFLEGGPEGTLHFGLGSTLAITREALDAAGGLLPLTHYLADDYELGRRIAAAGFHVALTRHPVETAVPPYTLSGFYHHQIRWARSTRDSRRRGYLGLGVTYALPWAIATVVASGAALWSFSLLSVVLLARVALALSVGVGILRDPQVLRDLWLLPLRDLTGLFFWLWSFAGDTVLWRGERFRLHHGKIVPIPASNPPQSERPAQNPAAPGRIL